jgi:predicted dehydrogenase
MPLTRRRFLQRSALAASALAFPGILKSAISNPPSSKLRLGFIGLGGQGYGPVATLREHDYVAFCDIDDERAAKAYADCPAVPRYKDFRVMLERHGKALDAVLVCTPDHTHFHPVIAALQRKLPVFVEKPLASTIWEGRLMAEAARKADVVTQMGIQGHSFHALRLLKEWLDAGVIGPVSEVYLWTDRPTKRDIHDFGADAPAEPVPKGLDWKLWLGPSRERAYSHHYVPQHWRAWWDFGQSALGDIGAHMFDVVEFSLGAGFPTVVTGEAQRRGNFATPRWSTCRYEFPARGGRPAFTLHWHSGVKDGKPFVAEPIPHWPAKLKRVGTGMAFVGPKGMIHISDMRVSSRPEVYPESLWEDFSKHLPAPTLPRFKGNHFSDWINAIRNGSRAGADFAYAAPLCEVTFLGNLALRTGREIRWDPVAMKATGVPEADAFIRPPFERKGWEYRI